MTAALPLSNDVVSYDPHPHNSMEPLEMSFRKSTGGISPEDAERLWFAGLLKKAFPEYRHSDNALAEAAAEVLTSDKRPVTARTVRNWLRCETTPHFRYVLRVIALVGAEAVFQIIDPENDQ